MKIAMVVAVLLYFGVLMVASRRMAKKESNNADFFRAGRRSAWWMVALGMVAASISGVSVVSVPGMVGNSGFTYLQTVAGFFFGYLVVAYLLLPLYYKSDVTTIYSILGNRIGDSAQRTSSVFFIVSKLVTAGMKLYVAALLVHELLFGATGMPFAVTVCILVGVIWLYTHRGGMRSILLTDCIQTVLLVTALVLIAYDVLSRVDGGVNEVMGQLLTRDECRLFEWDVNSSQNFFKQFVGGVFIVIAMTGLDQDLMQKNLTCRTLKDSQKNMLTYGALFLPLNLLLLVLGFAVIVMSEQHGIELPAIGDRIIPYVVSSHLSDASLLLLLIALLSASMSSVDSALTSITTTLFVDVLKVKDLESRNAVKMRKWLHLVVCVVFCGVVLCFDVIHAQSVLDLIYTLVGYLYGPLLGMFAFAMFVKRDVRKGLFVPLVAVASPLVCYGLSWCVNNYFSYSFGYELLILNGFLTFVGLLLVSKRAKDGNHISGIQCQ